METKAKFITAALLFLLLQSGPGLSRGLRARSTNSEVYEIDYRGPETHTYIPPPDRAGDRAKAHYNAIMARRKPKRHGEMTVG